MTPAAVWTIGHVSIHPNASSIVLGLVDFSVRWHDGSDDRLDRMTEIPRESTRRIASGGGFDCERSGYSAVTVTKAGDFLKGAITRAAGMFAPNLWRTMPSSALHDAANVSRILPAAMMFVSSINGVGQGFAADTTEERPVLGARMLAASVGNCSGMSRVAERIQA